VYTSAPFVYSRYVGPACYAPPNHYKPNAPSPTFRLPRKVKTDNHFLSLSAHALSDNVLIVNNSEFTFLLTNIRS
jgi:hypothetical protein